MTTLAGMLAGREPQAFWLRQECTPPHSAGEHYSPEPNNSTARTVRVMTEKGIEEMEKRADVASSPWRVVSLLAVGMAVGRILFGKVRRLVKTAANRSTSD
jgi:hypothetical protein